MIKNIDDFIIEDSVLTAYVGTKDNLIIPDCVEVIADNVFKDIRFYTIYIPKNVKRIEGSPFIKTELTGSYVIPQIFLEAEQEIYDSQNENWTFVFDGNIYVGGAHTNVPMHFEKVHIDVSIKEKFSFDFYNKKFILKDEFIYEDETNQKLIKYNKFRPDEYVKIPDTVKIIGKDAFNYFEHFGFNTLDLNNVEEIEEKGLHLKSCEKIITHNCLKRVHHNAISINCEKFYLPDNIEFVFNNHDICYPFLGCRYITIYCNTPPNIDDWNLVWPDPSSNLFKNQPKEYAKVITKVSYEEYLKMN